MSLTLSVLPGEYAVCQLAPNAVPPAWAMQGEFWTVSRTADELSMVCAAENVPDGVRAQKGWAALKLQGPFEFTLTGILASVLNPLKASGIGIFALSTFDTDYVLVAQEQLALAVQALREGGHRVIEVEGDPQPPPRPLSPPGTGGANAALCMWLPLLFCWLWDAVASERASCAVRAGTVPRPVPFGHDGLGLIERLVWLVGL